MRLFGPFNSGVAAGSAGSATANATTADALSGAVHGIYIKYNDSPPGATTDVTVATLGTSPSAPAYNLVSKANSATDAWYYPRVQVHDTSGAAIAGEYTPLLLHDKVKVTIAQANAGDSVDIWLLLDDRMPTQ